jgi:hypothetical protein
MWISLQVFLYFNGEESVYYYVETYIILFLKVVTNEKGEAVGDVLTIIC